MLFAVSGGLAVASPWLTWLDAPSSEPPPLQRSLFDGIETSDVQVIGYLLLASGLLILTSAVTLGSRFNLGSAPAFFGVVLLMVVLVVVTLAQGVLGLGETLLNAETGRASLAPGFLTLLAALVLGLLGLATARQSR